MAVFGMTRQRPEPEKRAVRAALTIGKRLEMINQKATEQVEIGIGINTGPAVAGYQGTEKHVEFTVLGHAVNVALGLERLARPSWVLIGHTTYEAIEGKFELNNLGPVELKRPTNPIGVYEVVGQPI